MAENTNMSITQQGHPSTRILGEKKSADYQPQNQTRKKPKLLQSALQKSRSCNQTSGTDNRSDSGKDRRTKPPSSTAKSQQPTRTPGEQKRSQSLEDNQTGEKVQQSALEKNQICNKPAGEKKRSDSEKENSVQTPQSTEKGHPSDAVSTGKKSGADWLRKHGENTKKKESNEKGSDSTLGKRTHSSVAKPFKVGENQRQETSTGKKLHTESESAQEQRPTTEQISLRVKWNGKSEGYTHINVDPHERIIDAVKRYNLTKKYKESNELIIFSNNLKAIINPSVPCGSLGKDKTLILRQHKLKDKPTVTPPYKKGSGGVFIKVKKNGQTEGGAVRTILHCKKQGSDDNTPLAVFGYGDETIEEALKNDKRFKDLNMLYLVGTKLDKYVGTITLSTLSLDDTYTIFVHDNSDTVNNHTNTASHGEVTESSPSLTTNPANDDPEELILTEAYKQITERCKTEFDAFVKKNRGLTNAWHIIRQNFSDNARKAPVTASTHRLLTKHMDSVAKMQLLVSVTHVDYGTCFCVTGDLFLTCHHVVKSLLNNNGPCKATIIFYYEDQYQNPNFAQYCCPIEILSYSEEHDFAFFRAELPSYPGLLPYVALPPENGTASVIGHPGGNCKQIDLCSVINFSNRVKDICETIARDPSFLHIVNVYHFMEMQDPGVVTYKTCLYGGASGSPVFDEHGQLVAMHTAGYLVDAPGGMKSVIEYGRSIVDILIYGAVDMKDFRLQFKNVVDNNQSLSDYIYRGSHPVLMQPTIRRLLQKPEFNNNAPDSPMDTSG